MNLHEHLGHWETFYVLVGTAGATLAGLTFVAITAASGFASRENVVGLRSHLDPSVVAFALTLILSCVLLMPTLTPLALGLLLLCSGVYMGLYTSFIARQINLLVRRTSAGGRTSYRYDIFDRVFYGLIPVSSSVLLVGCGVLVLLNKPEEALSVLGVTLLVLIAMGIRNALDMLMLTLVSRPGEATSADAAAAAQAQPEPQPRA